MKTILNSINLKKEVLIIGISILAAIFITLFTESKGYETQNIQSNIANEIIRFHVIANSDSDVDQSLKLELKNEIVDYMNSLLSNSQCIEETRQIINDNIHNIQNHAMSFIQYKGYDYNIKTYLDSKTFPVKTYGDIVLPSGEYEALVIEIGKAQGKNWWCIMFPPLCFIDATSGVVPDSSKEQLQSVLTEDEYQSILLDSKPKKIKIKFRLFNY